METILPKPLLQLWLLAFVLVLASLRIVTAQTISAGSLIYNTNQPDYGSFPAVYAGQWLAAPFRTGTNPAQLTSITLYEKTFANDGSFWVSILADNNGLPGVALPGGGLSGSLTPQGFAFQTYSATQMLTLAPNTLYWVLAASDGPGTSGGAYGWAWAANSNYTSSVSWTFFGYEATTFNEGGTWNSTANYPTPLPLLLAINGVIVPEPSVSTFASLALVILLLRTQRAALQRPSLLAYFLRLARVEITRQENATGAPRAALPS